MFGVGLSLHLKDLFADMPDGSMSTSDARPSTATTLAPGIGDEAVASMGTSNVGAFGFHAPVAGLSRHIEPTPHMPTVRR